MEGMLTFLIILLTGSVYGVMGTLDIFVGGASHDLG